MTEQYDPTPTEQSEATDVEELNDEGLGATITEGEPSTFEPEEDEGSDG